MKRLSILLKPALIVALAISAVGSNLPLPPAEATSSITARELKKHVSFLASDELGGRYSLSPSIRIAARYLASELESYGYRGGARDGSFFQKVPLIKSSVEGGQIILKSGQSARTFKFGEDFAINPPANFNFDGGLAFAGYGICSPRNKHDDYAGLDVKGKVVVAVEGLPQSLSGARLSEEERGLRAALSRGAAGIIIISPQWLMVWDRVKDSFSQRARLSLPPRRPPAIIAGPSLVKALAEAIGIEADQLSQPAGKPLGPAPMAAAAEISLSVKAEEAPLTQNVVGVLEGSDPKLKGEYIVLSAHYDHLETGADGQVYNGADDDASGTAAVLEIAQAFALGPRPRRSVLVIFHTAEELGLFGSEYNTDYEPVVPLESLVADFNIDMIGRSRSEGDADMRLTDKNSIYIIGSDKLSSELHRISEQTNADTVRFRLDYTYNDENHRERLYYRSDHYNYAKHGIPVIFYFTGLHRDYHRTTDDPDKLDYEKMERISRLIFATAWRVANMDHRLKVDVTAR